MIQREKTINQKNMSLGKNRESRLNRQRHYNCLKDSQKAERKVLDKVKKMIYG